MDPTRCLNIYSLEYFFDAILCDRKSELFSDRCGWGEWAKRAENFNDFVFKSILKLFSSNFQNQFSNSLKIAFAKDFMYFRFNLNYATPKIDKRKQEFLWFGVI